MHNFLCKETKVQPMIFLIDTDMRKVLMSKPRAKILCTILVFFHDSEYKQFFLCYSLRVSELLYDARDDWISVCRCMISDTFRHDEIWTWLGKLPTPSFQSVVFAHCVSLARIDASRLASLIAVKIPTKLAKILERLSNEDSSLEYSVLSALHNISQYKEEEETKCELSTENLEKYLSLMCEHAPDKVVGHVKSHHGCRLDEALKIVRENGHREAEAVMLEKLGNYQEAFDLLLAGLNERLQMVVNQLN